MANFLREHSQGTYYGISVTTYQKIDRGRVKSARYEEASIRGNEGGQVSVIKGGQEMKRDR